MSEINLLHGDQGSSLKGGFAFTVMARLLLVIVFAMLLIYAGMYFYTWSSAKKLVNVKQEVQTIQAEALANTERNELVTRQEQLAKLETLVTNHSYWSYLLPELASVTLRSAKYVSIEAKSDGRLNLAVSLPNYTEVEKYMQIFDLPEYNEQFSNVRIVSIETAQKETTIETLLRLQLSFNPEFIKGRMQ